LYGVFERTQLAPVDGISETEPSELHLQSLLLSWRNPLKKRCLSPTLCFLFLTLFWLCHYCTLAVISSLFQIPQFTISGILKRTTVALSKYFKNEIKLPSDYEVSLLMYSYGHNSRFMMATCVLDGTEIKISRPSHIAIHRKTCCGKKKQN
jgi:hypothetical protein